MSSSSSPPAQANSPRTPTNQVAPQHNARALCSQSADETIELDSMPPSPSSSSTTPLDWLADIPSGQPHVGDFEMVDRLLGSDSMQPSPSSSSTLLHELFAEIPSGQPRVLNYETTERLLNEWVEHEPLPTLGDIIEWALATLEAPFISPEAAALAVTAVVATTTPTITTTAAATTTTATTTTTTRRSTRTRRAPERFDPTPSTSPHHYEVAGIHGHFQVGRVDYYLVSWVGYDADWMWLPESDLACSSMVRRYRRNVNAANNNSIQREHTRTTSARYEVAAVHGCFEEDNGDQWYLLSWAGYKAGWQWVQEHDCSCYELIRAFDNQLDRAIQSWSPNQHVQEMWN